MAAKHCIACIHTPHIWKSVRTSRVLLSVAATCVAFGSLGTALCSLFPSCFLLRWCSCGSQSELSLSPWILPSLSFLYCSLSFSENILCFKLDQVFNPTRFMTLFLLKCIFYFIYYHKMNFVGDTYFKKLNNWITILKKMKESDLSRI